MVVVQSKGKKGAAGGGDAKRNAPTRGGGRKPASPRKTV